MARRNGQRSAEFAAEKADDLLDLHNLFRRGENERGEAFPGILSQQPQPATMRDACTHRFVIREGRENGIEINFRLQISGEPMPALNGDSSFCRNAGWRLLQPDPLLANDTFPRTFDKPPSKSLAGG